MKSTANQPPANLQALSAEVSALVRRLDGLEDDSRDNHALLSRIAQHVGLQPAPVEGDDNRDQPVVCPKCGSRVGYYDDSNEYVRARHKDHLVWMRLGVGGSIVIVCRKCSHLVEINYRPPDQVGEVAVRDDLMVLTTAQLTEFLANALNSGTGQVTLKLTRS